MEKIKQRKISNPLAGSIAIFIAVVLFFGIRLAGALELFDWMGEASSWIVNGVLVQFVSIFLAPVLIYMFLSKRKPKEMLGTLGFKKTHKKVILYSILGGVAMFFGVMVLSIFFQYTLAAIGYSDPFRRGEPIELWWVLLLTVLVTAIMPALCEEVLTRGVLMNSQRAYGIKKVIIISAVVFALMHFNINQVFYALLVGLFLATITHISKSIWPAIIMHFISNFFATLFGYLHYNEYFGKQLFEFFEWALLGNPFLAFVNGAIILATAIVIIAFVTGKIFLISKDEQVKKKLKTMAANHEEAYEGEIYVKMKDEVIAEFNPAKLRESGRVLDYLLESYREDSQLKKETWKKERLAQVFLFGAIFLSGAMTIATLVWGLFI
ncbi:MAG: CPBP family intramembrane metalloprotease [Firmicutes bacterium]|nr:CPBP family intramembrane metalloprotease [Bacillota bacterium]